VKIDQKIFFGTKTLKNGMLILICFQKDKFTKLRKIVEEKFFYIANKKSELIEQKMNLKNSDLILKQKIY
jgi:hypothetical protein